jgi:hypothetical protein
MSWGVLLALWGWGGFDWPLRRGPCRRFFTWHCWPLCGGGILLLCHGVPSALSRPGPSCSRSREFPCRGFLLNTIGPCAGRHFVAVPWRAVGAFQAWAVLLALSRVPCRSFLLNTISPCAGRHFISFSNGEKKRSKENAYKRQPVESALAQPRPWSESRTVPAVQHAIENPSCFTRQCTLRPHGRIYSAASASVLVSTSVLGSASVLASVLVSASVLGSALLGPNLGLRPGPGLRLDLDLGPGRS